MNRALLIAAFSLVAGCFSLGDPPPGAQISCDPEAEENECPDGTLCHATLKRCIPLDDVDQDAPGLADVSGPTPDRGGAGTTFELVIDPDEDLGAPPIVTLDTGADDGAPFAVAPGEGDAWVATYTATGAEPEGPAAIAIVLVDESQNASDQLPGGTVTLDFTPPALTGNPRVAPTLARPGDELSITIEASEPLAVDAPPIVQLEHEDGVTVLTMTSTDGATYTHVVAADDPPGRWTARVKIVDRSGNAASGLFGGDVVVDAAAPGVVVDDGGVLVPTIRRAIEIDDLPGVVVGQGDAVVVQFAVDEYPAERPVVEAVCAGGARFPMVEQGVGATAFTFVYVVDGAPDGACSVEATLVDEAGNTSTVPLGLTFTVDTTPPAPPDVDTNDRVVYVRAPYGRIEDPRSRFTIEGQAGAVEAIARVNVYAEPDAGVDDAIATVGADDAGAFGAGGSFALNPVDRAQLWIAQVDRAGNEGPRRRVRDVDWIAGLGGKVAGSELENPFSLQGRRLFTPIRDDASATDLGAQDGADVDDAVAARTYGAGRFIDGSYFDDPTIAAGRAAATYDPVRGRLVVVPGDVCACGEAGGCEDVVERSDVLWRVPDTVDPEGDGDPAMFSAPAAAFMASIDATVLVGGGQTWSYDGRSWKRVCSGGCEANGPPPRVAHAVAYDPVRRVLVLFGGRAPGFGALQDDTWEFDGASWRRVCTSTTCASAAPGARVGHAMAWDEENERVVLFGGETADGLGGDELWTWDGSNWLPQCTDATCAATKPPGRSDHAMAYDPLRGVLVVHGGDSTTAVLGVDECGFESGQPLGLSDTWEFDGAQWSAGPSIDPGGFDLGWTGHALVWDAVRGKIVMVGGNDGAPCGLAAGACARHGQRSAAHEYDGVAWLAFSDEHPQSSFDASMAYDASAEATIHVGDEIHRWTGAWTLVSATPTTLAVGGRTTATYGTSGVMSFGGLNGDAAAASVPKLLVDGAVQNLCTSIFTPCTSPAWRKQHVVQQSKNGVLVMGGLDASEAYLDSIYVRTGGRGSGYDTFCTSCDPAATPVHLVGAASAYDRHREVTVLFGGSNFDADQGGMSTRLLWEFDGAAFTNKTQPSTGPEDRMSAGLAYDPLRRRTMLFGGIQFYGLLGSQCEDGVPECGRLWQWDGAEWLEPDVVDPEDDGNPGPRSGLSMSYDDARGVVVVHGGSGGDETWLWQSAGGTRPAHVGRFAYLRAGTNGTETIEDVVVRAVAGGRGAPDDTILHGVDLLVWDGLDWRKVASNSASPASPAALTWSYAAAPFGRDSSSLRRLFAGKTASIQVAIAPQYPGGSADEPGQIATDALDVVVRYRLPQQ